MDRLFKYKEALIKLGKTKAETDFLETIITQWYIRSEKIRDVFPVSDIVDQKDLEYANKHKNTNFRISKTETKQIYDETIGDLSDVKLAGIKPDWSAISPKQKKMLKEKYKLNGGFDYDAAIVINVYKFMGMNNIHLSIPDIKMNGFKAKIDLFGSPLNTFSKQYCSLFEFEKHFGSLGNFFDYNLEMGNLYFCNPPFDETVMDRMADRLIEQLDILGSPKLKKKTSDEEFGKIGIFVTLPVWDSESQRKMKIRDYKMEFPAFEKLMKCEYLICHRILDRNTYMYYDFYTGKYTPASYTHAIMLGFRPDLKKTFESILEQWRGKYRLMNSGPKPMLKPKPKNETEYPEPKVK